MLSVNEDLECGFDAMWRTLDFPKKYSFTFFNCDLYDPTHRNKLNGLVSTVAILSNDTGMEFCTKKCGIVILKRGKVVKFNGLELPSGDKIKEYYMELATWLKS